MGCDSRRGHRAVPAVPGLPWSPQGRDRGWEAPVPQWVPGHHKQRGGLGSLWRVRWDQAGMKGAGLDPAFPALTCSPPFPGWQREGEKVNNAQTPRGPAVAAAPDISPTCLPRQTFCRDPRAALLSSISCSLTTARNWQQPLWPAAQSGRARLRGPRGFIALPSPYITVTRT